MQDMTDRFRLRKTINQYKQLCSSISPASNTSCPNERDYSDIEQNEEESTDDKTKKAELVFQSQDPDIRRNHSVAHESFRMKTKDKTILRETISFELSPHVETSDLIQKLDKFARKAKFHLQND